MCKQDQNQVWFSELESKLIFENPDLKSYNIHDSIYVWKQKNMYETITKTILI